MKTFGLSPFAPLLAIVAVLSLANSAGAADPVRPAPEAKRPPLHVLQDNQAIDRNAADRVSYAAIVKHTAPSVVYVYSSKTLHATRTSSVPGDVEDQIFRQFFGSGARSLPVPDQVQHGLGSGIVISSNGYILTNNHVVEGADDVKVSLGDSNRRYDAKVIGSDQLADVAVLRIEAEGLQPATFGDSAQMEIGDVVLAIGNPFGVGQSVSRGIVSALGRGPGIEAVEDFIQTDAAINPGNSGGALLDTQGRVVGINTAMLSASQGFAGVGFAIPSNLARSVAEQIVGSGRVSRGFLGVSPQELTPELADHFKTDEGALVSEVTADGPAEKAGLLPGDIITKINDRPVSSAQRLLLLVSQFAPETEVTIAYRRDGQSRTAKATLAHRPEQNLAAGGNSSEPGQDTGVLNGVGVGDLSPALREQLQVPARIHGAVITGVDPTSPSAREGLREGDIIIALDDHEVTDAAGAVKLSEQIKGPRVMVRIWREGRSRFVLVNEGGK